LRAVDFDAEYAGFLALAVVPVLAVFDGVFEA
jgi:hypothetical protein